MILKDYAKENGLTLAEAKELTGLTHWKQTVPESCDEIAEVVEEVIAVAVEVAEEIKPVEVAVVKAVIEVAEDVISEDVKLKSVRGLGTKSPYWEELRGNKNG